MKVRLIIPIKVTQDKDNIKNFWEISKRLKEVKEGEGYKDLGFKSFEDYSFRLFELAKRTANEYIQARNYIEKHSSDRSLEIEHTKIIILSTIKDEDLRNKYHEKVFKENISKRLLKDEFYKKLNKK